MIMANFEIVSKSVQTSATYIKDNYKVELNFLQDKENSIESIYMTIYKGDGIYAGNVNANRSNDGSLQFSFTSIAQDDLVEVTSIVNEVNQEIVASLGDTEQDSAEETTAETDNKDKEE